MICAIETNLGEEWTHLEAAISQSLPPLFRLNIQYVRVQRPADAVGCSVYVWVGRLQGRDPLKIAEHLRQVTGTEKVFLHDLDNSGNLATLEHVSQEVAEQIQLCFVIRA